MKFFLYLITALLLSAPVYAAPCPEFDAAMAEIEAALGKAGR